MTAARLVLASAPMRAPIVALVFTASLGIAAACAPRHTRTHYERWDAEAAERKARAAEEEAQAAEAERQAAAAPAGAPKPAVAPPSSNYSSLSVGTSTRARVVQPPAPPPASSGDDDGMY